MKRFIGTKIINAKPMTRDDVEKLLQRDIGGKEIGDGYLVEYENGYQSWSPKDVFENAYRSTDCMTFGDALIMLKDGKKVARAGWNGKGMHVRVFDEMGVENFNPMFVIRNVNGSLSTWVPSINDCLAEDWMVVE